MKLMLLLLAIFPCVLCGTASQKPCPDRGLCKKSMGSTRREATDILINQAIVPCSSLEQKALESYTNASGSLQTAADYMQSYMAYIYSGNWAVLYSTNFGMTFVYVTPNSCEFTIPDGIYCALFQEPPSG